MEFQDDSETIEAVAFNDVASKFHNELVLGVIYSIETATIELKKFPDPAYTHKSQIVCSPFTTITKISPENEQDFPKKEITYLKLAELKGSVENRPASNKPQFLKLHK